MAERTRHIYAQRSFRFLVERDKTSAKRLVGETAVFSPSHDPRGLPLFPLHRLPTTQNDLCDGERPHHIKQAALVTERERHVTKKKRVERTNSTFGAQFTALPLVKQVVLFDLRAQSSTDVLVL